MNISEIFKKKKVLSFEVFPPKDNTSYNTFYNSISALKKLNPDFISITCGAGGSEKTEVTLEIAKKIQTEYEIPALVHLPGIHLTKREVSIKLQEIWDSGIRNILALRGDKVPGIEIQKDFLHASDLIYHIKSSSPFHISGACYPEGHQEAKSFNEDIKYLHHKVNIGAEHLISQLFLDNVHFYKFLEAAHKIGISVPIEAGIIPIVNKKKILKMVNLCKVSVPKAVEIMIEKYGNDPVSFRSAGIEYAIYQGNELLKEGVDGIHLYILNDADTAEKICKELSGY
ncbi:MAG: methylenetetrahydrofolate reductase [NAD(P)H] [Fusobacteriaceae bacterium]|jgi:methylenetetrahydrofolate reductase (NADPH)|nr:methylenetetrahydrofolate reductase [NAD(P)H] [Fusobacteriaceae bacterium]